LHALAFYDLLVCVLSTRAKNGILLVSIDDGRAPLLVCACILKAPLAWFFHDSPGTSNPHIYLFFWLSRNLSCLDILSAVACSQFALPVHANTNTLLLLSIFLSENQNMLPFPLSLVVGILVCFFLGFEGVLKMQLLLGARTCRGCL
jgi:hypothetical protein